MKDFKLFDKIMVVVSIMNFVQYPFTGVQIGRSSTPMQFILQSVFDLLLKVLRDIIPVGDVSDPSHRNCHHKLVTERRQVLVDKPH
jgi:hypothetical protein